MHIDRLRWLVEEKYYLTLAGAVELAKAAPDLLKQLEQLNEAAKKIPERCVK